MLGVNVHVTKWNLPVADREVTGYVLVKKKLIVTWIVTNVALVLLIGASFQYTNYIAQQLCGVVNISLNAYNSNPRPTETGKTLAAEFHRISKKYHCN